VNASASAANLAVTELNYNPHAPNPALGETNPDNNEYEFIELRNIGTEEISLVNVRFTTGITFDFSSSAARVLGPGQYVVVVRNVDAFRSRYGPDALVAGAYSGRLDNGGEAIALVDRAGAPIAQFTYDDAAPWPLSPDGLGRSLVAGPGLDLNLASSWRESLELGGSPGRAGNTAPSLTAPAAAATDEDVTSGPVAIRVEDLETPAGNLTIRMETDNPALVPLSGLSLTGSGPDRVLVITPVADRSGVARIVLTADDGAGGTASRVLVVTVNPVNDGPVLAPLAPRRVNEGSLVEFQASAADIDTPNDALRYHLEGDVPVGLVIDPVTGVVRWTPGDGPRTAQFTVRVDDNGSPVQSDRRQVTITVDNVAPVLPALAGASLEAGQRLTRSVQPTDPGQDLSRATFDPGDGTGPQPLSLASDGTIVLDHVYAQAGTFTARVRVEDRDGGAAESSFLVDVQPAADRTGPRILSLTVVREKRQSRGIRLAFSEPITAARATNLGAYVLTTAGRDRTFGTRDDVRVVLRTASYDAATNTVLLTPRRPLRARTLFQLQTNGTSAEVGLTDLAGNLLDGNADGVAGGDDVRTFTTL
jgi:hypothetical protein